MNTLDPTPFPARPDIAQYRKQAKELLKALHSEEPQALECLRSASLSRVGPKPLLADAQAVIAREHGMESWPKFVKFVAAAAFSNTLIGQFERAAEAIVTGDAGQLRGLLAANPELIRARSERGHHCTLLHYIGANGFEGYRQKTPKNAPEILRILLEAGAEVDALADAYGRGTTLGLVASSVWPVVAGVQAELMDILIDAGADVNGTAGTWNIAMACLANGRGAAALRLVDRGARTTLESAAGTGKLDQVSRYFDAGLKETATQEEFTRGFGWACEYGHDEVVEFLLEKGAEADAGLNWAVIGAQVSTVRLLLARRAQLEALNSYGGTALGQALWSAKNDGTGIDFKGVIGVLVGAGARVDCYPGMEAEVEAALRG